MLHRPPKPDRWRRYRQRRRDRRIVPIVPDLGEAEIQFLTPHVVARPGQRRGSLRSRIGVFVRWISSTPVTSRGRLTQH